jgi:Mg2+-importing ATPase
MLERAQPWWLIVAAGLQALTYVSLAQVWRLVAETAHHPLRRPFAARVALAKLFMDQALPTGGISGNALVSSALEHKGVPHPAATAAIVIELAAYYFAYALSLLAALAVAAAEGHATRVLLVTALGFAIVTVATGIGILALSRTSRSFDRVPLLRRAQRWISAADRSLTGNHSLLMRAIRWELAIVILDSSTLWVLIHALGVHASIGGVFASFMISSLARTVSIVPGGLGVFEGAAVITLKQVGVPVEVGLSAALLFRGLSYWLPMLPGFAVSRRLVSAT